MAESATPLPLKAPPTQGVTGQRHPLQFILEYLYVEDDSYLCVQVLTVCGGSFARHEKLFSSCNVSHTSTLYIVYFTLVWTTSNRWKTITPNTKRENGLYPPTHSGFQGFATFEQMF